MEGNILWIILSVLVFMHMCEGEFPMRHSYRTMPGQLTEVRAEPHLIIFNILTIVSC